ncbi:hypothetical protein [Escherichia coli]|uniref:hypothetical protein n=1 Tax=Escherichia coli TaxID=562 RepID=UPI00092E8312
MTDFRGKTSIFSHPVYLFLRKFSLQDSRGGSLLIVSGLSGVHFTIMSDGLLLLTGISLPERLC